MSVESTQTIFQKPTTFTEMLGHLFVFSNTSECKVEWVGRRIFGGSINRLQSSQRGQAKTAEEEIIRGDQNGRNSFKEEEEETKAWPNDRFTW